LRVVGAGSLLVYCSSTLTNNALIQIAASSTQSSALLGSGSSDCWYPGTPGLLTNTASGVVENLAARSVSAGGFTLDNDGLVVARAGTLVWGSTAPTGTRPFPVSTGQFATDSGGALLLTGGTSITPATVFTNGITVSSYGSVSGEGVLPAGITLTIGSYGYSGAKFTGAGWLEARGGGTISGDIWGNVRFVGGTFSGGTIQPSGVAEATGLLSMTGPVTNAGMIRIIGAGVVYQSCGANQHLTNNSLIEVEDSYIQFPGPGLFGASGNCSPGALPTLTNAPTGTVASYAPVVNQSGRWENHGTMAAQAGKWLLQADLTNPVHTGYFTSEGSGHLVLCGLVLLSVPGEVAANVGLADGCGTIVADVTDFTAQQIQDIKDARYAAMGLTPPSGNSWPTCTFRGVDLVELFGYYPEQCLYTPQQFGADAFEFFIEWIPGVGMALDIGHAIFGQDLAGRELSPSQRILDGFFAVAPGVSTLAMKGTERLLARALANGFGDVCNSFSADTKVLLANGTRKPIGQIHRSDLVMAADPTSGHVGPRPVTNVIAGTGFKQLVDVDLSTGERITATANHPFWLEDQHAFVEAGSLTAGSLLRTSQGTYVQISVVTARSEWTSVYNLTVADLHTFYVGDAEVLVHNANPWCRSTASDLLRRALGTSPYANGQAHHIYGIADWGTWNNGVFTPSPLYTRLTGPASAGGWEIDLNGVANGLYLPSGPYSGLQFVGSFHSGMSAGYYRTYVYTYLDAATSKADALNRLEDLKRWLQNGCMPINAAGVGAKPAYGTCPPALVAHYKGAPYYMDIELPPPPPPNP
jgi:hypothetical protein